MNTVDTKTAEALKATIAKLVEQRDHEKACVVALRRVIADLLPFVLEDYYPDLATPGFRAAVEAAGAAVKSDV